MDKNTLTGLALIAAIMFGFYFCNQKPQERKADESPATETLAETETQQTMPLLAGDSATIAEAVRQAGTLMADGAVSVNNGAVNLSITDGHLNGTVKVGDEDVDIDNVFNPQSTLTGTTRTDALRALRQFASDAMRYQGFSRHMGGENREITLANNVLSLTLNTRGGMISSATLLNPKYRTEVGGDTAQVSLFHADTDSYAFTFFTADQQINTANLNFEATVQGDTTVIMALHPAEGASWEIRYTLAPDSYLVRMELCQQGMEGILPANTSNIELTWHQKMMRNELGRTFEERNSAIYYKYIGESPDDLSSSSNKSKSLNGRLRWVAFKNQFFSSVLIARNQLSTAELTSTVLKDDPVYLKDMTMTATAPYSHADGTAAAFDFYLGPNDYPLLSSLDKKLDLGEDMDLTRLIPLGWGIFRWINTLIVIPVFDFLGKYIANYGIIILLLTIFIKLIIFPFTFKSFKSQAKMRALAPDIKAINEKYPGAENQMKRSQETMALYSRAGASPFSGCLPMLLQMPVLIAMFSFFPSAIELRGQSFLWAHDLSAPDSILTLPFTIPFYGNHVSLFCLLMTAVNVIYIRLSMSSQPDTGMPGMKMMQYLMPVMFLFIFNDYASGLSYYYFLSLLITIVQTWVFRHFTDDDKLRAQMAENARNPKKKKGFMARLEEASRQAQAAQRAQQEANDRRARRRR